MLTLEECIALCGLTDEEVEAIGEHEHMTEIGAAEFGNYLLRSPEGELRIKRILCDDIEQALARGAYHHAAALRAALKNFVCNHPACEERHRQLLYEVERRRAGG